jgi:uncharacterized protein (UPF0332 family)
MALENWFQQAKLLKHITTKEELSAIFGVIDRNFKDASIKGLSSDQKYVLSYQASFEVALALIKCHGYRPVRTGHHYIVWQCLKELLNEEKIKKQILFFENAAKKRSKLSYDMAGLASQKEADEMCREAQDFVRRVKEEINKFSVT